MLVDDAGSLSLYISAQVQETLIFIKGQVPAFPPAPGP